MPHEKLAICVCVMVADQKPAPGTMTGSLTPVEGLNFSFVVSYVTYFVESAKNDSSAVTRFRRSDFIAAMYAFDLVLANFGIAIAARMPMITTTMSSSMRVKPLRWSFMGSAGREERSDHAVRGQSNRRQPAVVATVGQGNARTGRSLSAPRSLRALECRHRADASVCALATCTTDAQLAWGSPIAHSGAKVTRVW